jgi:hypothetical protein
MTYRRFRFPLNTASFALSIACFPCFARGFVAGALAADGFETWPSKRPAHGVEPRMPEFVAAVRSGTANPTLSSRTYGLSFERELPEEPRNHYAPLYEYLSLTSSNLGGKPPSLHFYGWGRSSRRRVQRHLLQSAGGRACGMSQERELVTLQDLNP